MTELPLLGLLESNRQTRKEENQNNVKGQQTKNEATKYIECLKTVMSRLTLAQTLEKFCSRQRSETLQSKLLVWL